MPTALKRKARRDEPVAAPAIAADRQALAKAIEAKRKADKAVEEQRQAIHRAAALALKASDDIATLRAKIAAADETDVKRAASLIKVDKPVVSPWSGESTRHAVERAERHLELTEQALKQLHKDMGGLQDDAAECTNAIMVEIKTLTVPLVQNLLAQLREHKRAAMITGHALAALLDDASPRDAPRFRDESRGMRADHAREAPLKEFKTAVERARFGVANDADQGAAASVANELRAALLALQADASAPLPEV